MGIRFSFLLALCFLIGLPQSFAQSPSVQVRGGEHGTYSRLVFDWPTKPSFEINKNNKTLEVKFNQAAQLDTTKVTASPVRNISNVKVTSQNPATLELTLPADSRHRAFHVGSKLVLDVYNPPGNKPTDLKPVASKQKTKTPKTATQTPEPETVQAEEEIKEEDIKTAADVPTVEEKPLDPSQIPTKQGSNLITIAASTAVGLAVFERGDELWVVTDKAELPLSPQISGPNAEYFLPIKEKTFDKGKAFITKTVPRNFTRTQGGGLLWKVIISPNKTQTKPIKPIRQDAVISGTRGGKIIWPFEEPGQIIEATDPITGQPLKIVTVKSSKDYSGPARSFVDFDVFPATAGLVIAPKVDDLDVRIISRGVEISRPDGLAILSDKQIKENLPKTEIAQSKTTKPIAQKPKIFDFQNWQLGGLDALKDNQMIILSELNNLPKNARDEDLMTLAKAALSNAMGSEALGFLSIIEDNNEDIAKTAEFRAIRGAARAIDYKTGMAFNDLSVESLNGFEEIGFWKAYALADLGDWRQAIRTLPTDAQPLYGYPSALQNRIAPVAAEVALRSGDTELALEILGLINDNKDLNPPQKAALNYLKGEAARQNGDLEKTKEYWEPLTTGKDDLYRAKAGLALTRLLVDEKELSPEKAIDNLERLRYAWRGDELEAQINYWLGRTYFEARQFVKGLNIMREAAGFSAGTNLGDRIANEMSDVFVNLYLSDALDKVTPLEAMALYEQFTELVPAGEKGDRIVERLADRLTQADILNKASELLTYQLNHRLDGKDAYNVGIKLAAINLIDRKPDEAIAAIDTAAEKLAQWPEEQQTPDKKQAIDLLRARALSLKGRPDQAIALLEQRDPNPTINRLRADIAWRAGYWDDAAEALDDVILDQNLSLTRPIEDKDSILVLQRAVALNLSDNRIALANMREKYSDAMAQTSKARIFEVITRPRQNAALADRETLMGVVSEVDLFSDFLESYKDVSLSTSN